MTTYAKKNTPGNSHDWLALCRLPSEKQKAQLDRLLEIPEGQRNSQFDRFQKGPVGISGPVSLFVFQIITK
jgi:hypothetical protein